MADVEPKRGHKPSVGRNAADRLLVAIGYPERIPNTDEPFTLRVDGKEVFVEESGGRIVLSTPLTEDDSMLPMLAAYAAGRMLHENATLAYGNFDVLKFQGLERTASKLPNHNVFLWQDASASADDRTLVRLFESFANSCDWWRARVDERGKGDAIEISEAVIRP